MLVKICMELLNSYLSRKESPTIIILLSFLFQVGGRNEYKLKWPNRSFPGTKFSSKFYFFDEVCSEHSRPHWSTSHSFSRYYPCYTTTHLIICFLVLLSHFPRLESINSSARFHSRATIFRSVLLVTDCIFQDGCNNFSQPTCSSYIGIDVLPMKIQGLRYLPLNLRKTATIAEVMPPDFWGQDMKEASASTQFSWDATFWNPAAILWGSTGHMESPRVGVFSRLSAPAEIL